MLCWWMTSIKCVIRNTSSVGSMWRKCQWKRKILVERADIVTWRSRYLKEVQEYRDNGHLMFYMQKTWTDSNLTFCKYWQEGEVMDIHTHYSRELGKQAYTAACRGNWWISSSMHISLTKLDLKQETVMGK